MGDNHIVSKIEDFLLRADDWAHSSEIAQHINHNRITVGKYLDIMRASGKVELKQVGKAKLWRAIQEKKKRILIADDELPIRKLIELTLGEEKYTFIEAQNGLEVLEQVQFQPDLILLDVMMPKMNGYEALEQLKKNPVFKHIPVIMISAKAEINDKIKGLQLGVSEYIVKPFDPSELQIHVESLLSDNKKENSLTGLPNVQTTQQYMNTIKPSSHTYVITITNYVDYLRQYGFKKSSETMKFLVKYIHKHLKDHSIDVSFFGHIHDSELFLDVSKNLPAHFSDKIKEVIPFFYNPDDLVIEKDTYYTLLEGNKIPAILIQLETYKK